jgi:MFS family permease
MTEAAVLDAPVAAPLPVGRRVRLLTYAAIPSLLFNVAATYNGFISLPTLFFLKNRLHLTAGQVAVFSLIMSIPLMAGFVFGFLRDRWSPFGTGDRGHLVVFGLATAAVYVVMGVAPPTYSLFLIGGLVATMAIQFVAGAVNGLAAAVGRKHGMTGQMSSAMGVAISLPAALSFAAGGLLSGVLEGQTAVIAARGIYFSGAAVMLVLAGYGALGPKALFADVPHEPVTLTPWADIKRLARHGPIYPALLVQLLWQFAPGVGVALTYHLAGDLHASDAQVGAFFTLFFGSFVPMYFLYGWLAQRFSLRTLLWIGAVLGVCQMVPLLFMKSAGGALWAAALLGPLGGLGQGAFQDLTMRSCPRGLEGTMMLLWWGVYWVSLRFGDLWGADLYDHHGGFNTAVWATIGVYALMLPALLLVPRRITAGTDAHA